jgi:hypothetical protein
MADAYCKSLTGVVSGLGELERHLLGSGELAVEEGHTLARAVEKNY